MTHARIGTSKSCTSRFIKAKLNTDGSGFGLWTWRDGRVVMLALHRGKGRRVQRRYASVTSILTLDEANDLYDSFDGGARVKSAMALGPIWSKVSFAKLTAHTASPSKLEAGMDLASSASVDAGKLAMDTDVICGGSLGFDDAISLGFCDDASSLGFCDDASSLGFCDAVSDGDDVCHGVNVDHDCYDGDGDCDCGAATLSFVQEPTVPPSSPKKQTVIARFVHNAGLVWQDTDDDVGVFDLDCVSTIEEAAAAATQALTQQNFDDAFQASMVNLCFTDLGVGR